MSAVNAPLHAPTSPNADAVVREFHEGLARSNDIAVAVAAIQALTTVIKKSTATTMMGINEELNDAAKSLQRCNPTAISLKAGCELFLRCVAAAARRHHPPPPQRPLPACRGCGGLVRSQPFFRLSLNVFEPLPFLSASSSCQLTLHSLLPLYSPASTAATATTAASLSLHGPHLSAGTPRGRQPSSLTTLQQLRSG